MIKRLITSENIGHMYSRFNMETRLAVENVRQGQTLQNMKAQKKLTRQNRETLRRLDHVKKLRLRNNKVEIENSIHLGMRGF